MTVKDRIERKVMYEPNTGCWYWIGALFSQGYGAIRINKKIFRAHRISYEIYNGQIPNGLYVRHSCHNPACVNPSHLLVGNQFDNMRDMVLAGRHNNKKRL